MVQLNTIINHPVTATNAHLVIDAHVRKNICTYMHTIYVYVHMYVRMYV